MSQIKEHIYIKLFMLLVVASLFAPTAIKFAHIFEHHNHKVCNGDQSTHIHEIDFDCEFLKLQLNTSFNFSPYTVELFAAQQEFSKIISQYQFLSKFQCLHVSLRGPPSLI